VASPDDVAKVAAFDALIHGETTAPTWRTWMTEHPHANPSGWLFVEEEATGRIVAALCLLPWRLSYAGVELRAGEMGVVGTLEEYRGRGLQRALNARYDELLRAGGFHLSHIQGIPYFYRQFGYEYAMPLEAWWRLELYRAPATTPMEHGCRPAATVDLPGLVRRYDETAAALDIAALRDEATWRYMLGPGIATETGAETWVVDTAQGAAGYFRVAHAGFGDGLIVAEASLMSHAAALAALATLRTLAVERGKPFIQDESAG
jgi:predicted acetyltransferase